MTNFSLSKRQIISLLILLALVLILPLALYLVRQSQEVRKRAQDIRQEIILSLNPQTNSQATPWRPEDQEKTITIKMNNTTTDRTLEFRVIGLELNFDPRVFEVETANLACNLPFVIALGNASKVVDNLISLVCYLPVTGAENNPQSLDHGTEMTVGSFKVKVKESPPGSSTEITFLRTNIPEEGELADLSKFGEKGTYYIGGTPITGTPTPTLTPTPTITLTPTPTVTLTPTPTATVTPTTTGATSTPTPTTPAGATSTPAIPANGCINGALDYNKGNISCDTEGLIDEADFGILMKKWHTIADTPVPTPDVGTGNGIADFTGLNGQPDGLVDEAELGQMLKYWKTQLNP